MADTRDFLEFGGVTISGFRAFSSSTMLDLGRITVLCGPNGLGKTTVFDAIDWALFGDRWRLGEEGADCVRNLWKSAPVSVELHTTAGTITRTVSSAGLANGAFRAVDLAFDPSLYDRARDAAMALRRLSYLPQHEMRELVEGNEETQAFILAALAGVPFSERFSRNLDNTAKDIGARLRAVEGERAELEHRRADLSERLRTTQTSLDQQHELVRRMQFFLSSASANVAELVGLVEGRLTTLRRSEIELTERLRGVERMRVRSAEIERELERVRERLALAVSGRETAAKAAQAADTEVHAAERRERSAREKLQQLEQRDATARAERERLHASLQSEGRIRELRQREASARSQIDQLAATLAEQEAALATITNEHREAAQECGALREALTAALSRREALESLRTEQRSVDARAEELREHLAKVAERHDANQTEIEKLTAAIHDEREKAGKSRRRGERLASLVQELAELPDVDGAVCPVCSHDHGTNDELQRRIRATISELRETSARIARIGSLEVSLRKLFDAKPELDAKLDGLRSELRNAEIAQNELSARTNAAAEDQAPADASSLEARVKDVEARVAFLKAESDKRERALQETRAKIEQGWRELALVESLTASEPAADLAGAEHARARLSAVETELSALATELDTARSELATAEAQLVETRSQARDVAARQAAFIADVDRMTGELDVFARERDALTRGASGLAPKPEQGLAAACQAEAERLKSDIAAVEAAAATGDELLKQVKLLLAQPRGEDLGQELEVLTRLLADVEARRAKLQRARDRLKTIGMQVQKAVELEAVRSQKVARETIDAVMRILAPHRHLNGVVVSDHGEVLLRDDDLAGSVSAKLYSSSGQLNCIALAVFLGIGLNTRHSRLRCLLMDEPVQNLDDVNLLNFLDLLRYVARTHQVVLSTANANLAELLKAKLGPWAMSERKKVVVHEFLDFDKLNGPSLRTWSARTTRKSEPGFDVVRQPPALESSRVE